MAGTRVKALATFCLIALCATSVRARGNTTPTKAYSPPYGANGNYTGYGLKFNYYSRSCPQVESLVTGVVRQAYNADNSIIAGLLRLFFHDCFVRGCDGSVLLDGADVEKLGAPNANSLRGFDVIDNAKTIVEQQCPGIVSCADIVSFAARDSIVLGGGYIPFGLWLSGRKDGDTSISSETLTELPAPFLDYPGLVAAFQRKGLNEYEMITLSAAHTIGRAHCGIILSRLYNFKGTGAADPSINTNYLGILRGLCPPTSPGSLINMDMTTPVTLDTNYIKEVFAGEGTFESDNALRTTSNGVRTLNILNNQGVFSPAFSLAVLKMGTIGVKTGTAGKIHVNCHTTAGAV